MAPSKATRREKAAPEGGQAPFLATKGKAHAAGSLDKLSPGDPGHGGTSPEGFPEKGVHHAIEKNFQFDAEGEKGDLLRVIHDGRVLFSGSHKEAVALHKSLSEALGK